MQSELPCLNGLRVIAEFFVVRSNLIRQSGLGMNMFDRELMSFFFVLSGFVVMYKHADSCFSTKEQVKRFLGAKWWEIYPSYIVGLAWHFPGLILSSIDLQVHCGLRWICSVLQLFMMDCWVGCGIEHVGNREAWLFSCLLWLFLVFPVVKGWVITFFHHRVWLKMGVISLLASGMLYPFQEFNIYSFCAIPLLRIGEFVVGCGAACALRQHQANNSNAQLGRYHWGPLILSLGGMILIYSILGSSHGMLSICLHQATQQSQECSLWGKSKWVDEHSTPCYTLGDKYVNKNSMAWAIIIYCIAQADLSGNTGRAVRFLQHDMFQFLSGFSLTLYLCHSSVAYSVQWGSEEILGWVDKWQEDALVVTVYILCLLLHTMIERMVSFDSGSQSYEDSSSSAPLISQVILEGDQIDIEGLEAIETMDDCDADDQPGTDILLLSIQDTDMLVDHQRQTKCGES
jgi:peptidoglycan/LPS O-acetylase OafA/YrhL